MQLTISEVKELEEKLNQLEKVELVKLNKTIAIVKEDESNSAENGALFALVDERETLKSTISEMRQKIKKSVIIDEATSDDIVAIGTSVTITDEDGEDMEYKIVSDGLGDPLKGKISCSSPLGRALIGKSILEVAEFEVNKMKNRFIVKTISLCA